MYFLGKYYYINKQHFAYDAITNKIFIISKRAANFLKSIPKPYFNKKLLINNSISSQFLDKEILISKTSFLYNYREVVNKYLTDYNDNVESLCLILTENCNFRCDYCVYSGKFANYRSHGTSRMSKELALKAIDFYIEHNKKSNKIILTFYGGEPLIEFDLMLSCLKYTYKKRKNKELYCSFTTNGSLLTVDKVTHLLKYNINISISLDGNALQHDKYRKNMNGNGTHNLILHNLNEIKKKYPSFYYNNIVFIAIITDDNSIMSIKEFYGNEMFERSTLRLSNQILPNNKKRNLKKSIYKRLKKDYLTLKAEGKTIKTFYSALFERSIMGLHSRPIYSCGDLNLDTNICIPGCNKLLMTPAGDFHICERINNNMSIGNLYNGLNSKRILLLIGLFNLIRNKYCTSCWAARLCKICYIHFFVGDHFSPSQFRNSCKNEKKNLEELIRNYIEVNYI